MTPGTLLNASLLTLLGIGVAVSCGGAATNLPPGVAQSMLWTTPNNSDTCVAYLSEAVPEHSLFETEEECEDWVATRRCRPGFTCYRGCQYTSCVRDGTTMTVTAGCAARIPTAVPFEPRSAALQHAPDWDELLKSIERRLRVKERVVEVVGSARPSESDSETARLQLARRRAEVVLAELVARGVPAQRLVAKTDWAVPIETSTQSGVFFELEPAWIRREDYDPDSDEYRNFCAH